MHPSSVRLVCTRCAKLHPLDAPLWRCPCGGPLLAEVLSPPPTLEAGAGRVGLWRYRGSLPILSSEAIVSLGEGMTPLVPAQMAGHDFMLKCDYCNPTGSWKDRGWSVAVSRLKELGIDAVVEDSSGNSGASLAAYGARAGIRVTVFVPHDCPPTKQKQIRAHGARVIAIPGGRDAVTAACMEAARTTFYAGHAWNPWFLTGPRTLAWEITEQIGKAPAAVFMPLGQGGLLLGLFHGFSALAESGQIPALPRLVPVQAAACAPVVAGWSEGRATPPPVTPGRTMADAIRTPHPVRYPDVIEAIRKSRGDAVAVQEDEIRQALHMLGRAGFFVEPTSAAAAAGALKWLPRVPVDGPVVIILTGHGLKAA